MRRLEEIIAANLAAWMAATPGLGTLQQVKAKSGASYGTLPRAKNGEANLTIENLEKIASAFGRTAAELMHEELPQQPPEVKEYVKTVEELTTSGKLSVEEVRAMTYVLKARNS